MFRSQSLTPMLALRLVTYLLVCDGIAALFLAGLIGPLVAALVVGAMLASWWLERARERGVVRAWVAWGLVGAAAVAIAMDLAYLASTALDGMVHLLLFLILARLFLCRSLRDLRDAGFLSFFLLVATSSATFSVSFLFVFLSFLVLATGMLMLHHIAAETERAAGPSGPASVMRVGLRSRLARVSLVGAAVTLALTTLLFFVIPRVGQATLPLRSRQTRMVTGFSDRVELGAFGDIETDKTVIMRVYLGDDTPDPALLPPLRWRGIVFDRFDGRNWAVAQFDRVPVKRWANGRFQLGVPQGRGPIVRQDIYLDPIGTDIVFAAPRALRLDLRAGGVNVDDMGSLSVPNASARLHYQAESELEMPPAAFTAVPVPELSDRARARYLQLPPLSPRIARLAREVAVGSHDPYESAVKLDRFLSSRFRYVLAKPQTSLDPLEEFLFVRRSGNCEYFAAALAVMLRTLDIPARVVGGFQQGEWNPYGRYFMVRLSDAHAWVEAYFAGLGWVTLDPSPRASAVVDDRPSPLALYLDAARMRWYRYVINWSLQDQRLFASTVQRQARDASLAFSWPGEWRSKLWFLIPAGVGVAGILGWLIWRFGRGRQARHPGGHAPRFYERALRALARRGLSPAPAETARQFWERTQLEAPGCGEPLGRITATYERTRFGLTALTEDEMREVERCLLVLERR
jgi:protein-glutamine gamma-glutamyltransferase